MFYGSSIGYMIESPFVSYKPFFDSSVCITGKEKCIYVGK